MIYVKNPFLSGEKISSDNQSLSNFQGMIRKNRWWITIIAIILIVLEVLSYFKIIT